MEARSTKNRPYGLATTGDFRDDIHSDMMKDLRAAKREQN
jgi:hypothetical protein